MEIVSLDNLNALFFKFFAGKLRMYHFNTFVIVLYIIQKGMPIVNTYFDMLNCV